MQRYHRRFGGTGTIVAVRGGWAFTAAHCLAAIDGRRGTPLAAGRHRFVVVRRWAPLRLDLALLRAVGATGARFTPAPRAVIRRGVVVQFIGHTGRRFQRRRAVVVAVTPTTAVAHVVHPRGACGSDSGGAVVVGDQLVGIATHRAGPARSSRCSSQLVFTRLDSRPMRERIAVAQSGA